MLGRESKYVHANSTKYSSKIKTYKPNIYTAQYTHECTYTTHSIQRWFDILKQCGCFVDFLHNEKKTIHKIKISLFVEGHFTWVYVANVWRLGNFPEHTQ